jgi:acyl-coenzyme A thioesterase PaaI-like protein
VSEAIADRLRSLADSLISNEITDEAAAVVLAHLEEVQNIVERFPHGSIYRVIPHGLPMMHSMAAAPSNDSVPDAGTRSADENLRPVTDAALHPFRLFSPIVGRRNPVAPPAVFSWEGERVIGTCTYGTRYEGAPGCVHGGFIAAVFDDCLGLAQGHTGQGGMTAYLTVQYRRPHRLNRLIRFEAWVESVGGRKIVCRGNSFDSETNELLAECEALFITVDFAKIQDASSHRLG